MKNLSKIVLGIAIVLGLSACQKQFNPDLKQIETQIQADNIITETFLTALQTTDNQLTDYQFAFSGCATVTTVENQKKSNTTVIDFWGDCGDDVKRTGTIVFKWDRGWKVGLNSAKLVIEFRNYKYENNFVTGKIYVVFAGFDENQNPQYKIRSRNLKIVFSDNTQASFSYDATVNFLKGFYTISNKDDILKVNYKSKGIDRNGKKFVSVAHDLIFNYGKKDYIPVSGTKVLQVDGDELILNYGDGELDTKFTVTKNNQTEELIWRN